MCVCFKLDIILLESLQRHFNAMHHFISLYMGTYLKNRNLQIWDNTSMDIHNKQLLSYILLPAGNQGIIPYRHRATVCRFELGVLPLLVHVYITYELRSTSLMSSSLILQQCSACLILIVFMMGGRWPYSNCFVRCCL